MADTPIERLEAYGQDYLGVHELASVLGQAKQTVSNKLYRNPDKLPEPVARLGMGPIWKKDDVKKFLSVAH